MYGNRLVLFVAVSTAIFVSCKELPAPHTSRKATPPPIALEGNHSIAVQPDETMLVRRVQEYEAEPTGDRAAAVWEAFADVDTRLAELKLIVSSRAGGTRAEAEVQRIELQRARDKEMARFASTQARLKTAHAAFEALAASFDRDGIRAAASIVARGMNGENRLNEAGVKLRSGRSQMP